MVLRGEIKTPPMSEAARRETGFLLRRLQQGGEVEPAPLTAHAEHRPAMPRIAHKRRQQDVARYLPD